MSRAHLEQGRVQAPPGDSGAPPGKRGARWAGGSSTSLSRHRGARLAVSASQAAVSVQPGSPAAWGTAPRGECADPRARGREQDSTMPSAAAPRALTPLPVSGRSETGAGTRPESDGMAGPIKGRSGSPGGGAGAGEPRWAGSLREAQPLGGPAEGWKVVCPEARGWLERPRGGLSEPRRRPGERGARQRGGARGRGVCPALASGPGPRGRAVVLELPRRRLSRPWTPTPGAHSDPCRAKWGLPGGGPEKDRASKRITGRWVVRKPSSIITLFLPQARISRCPAAVNPKVPSEKL